MISVTHNHADPRIDAGDLDRLLTVEVKQESAVGSRGQAVFDWVTDPDTPHIRGSVLPLTGRKLQVARQLVEHATCEIVTRYFRGMGPKKRLRLGNSVFNVGAVLDVLERNAKLVFTASESVEAAAVTPSEGAYWPAGYWPAGYFPTGYFP